MGDVCEVNFNRNTKLLRTASVLPELFNPQHQYPDSPYSSPCISFGTDKENLFNNQNLLSWRSFSFFLGILTNDSAMLLLGEIRC